MSTESGQGEGGRVLKVKGLLPPVWGAPRLRPQPPCILGNTLFLLESLVFSVRAGGAAVEGGGGPRGPLVQAQRQGARLLEIS